ncbi:MAG: hypothetical protein WA210_18405, partial [Burkholderiaceae bacterium]
LRGVVGAAAGIREDDDPEAARAKLLAVAGDANVAERLASAVGLSEAAFPLHEVNWATRKLLERLALSTPVIAFVDDVHWAEPAFLDLLEHVLDTAGGAPIMLLATARQDVLEKRPQWSQRQGATRLLLGPLSDAASALVIENLLGSTGLPQDVVARIVVAAEGNPLFIEQMLSMLLDADVLRQVDGRWVRGQGDANIDVPPTIHALLEARLDNLGREERVAVEPASVIGLEFAQRAVESLTPEAIRATLAQQLSALARKQFIDPATSRDAETIYRFHHQLVRDTVYSGLLKRTRATLHIQFVRWADRINADRDRALEFQEVLGYHLEQAHRYLAELGPLDEQGVAVGADAARRLAGAGKRASARGDMHAAANLFRRAAALFGQSDPERLELLPQFGQTLMDLGDFQAANEVLAEAIGLADRQGNRRIKIAAQLVEIWVRRYTAEPGPWTDDALRMASEAVPLLEHDAAHLELASAWRLIGLAHGIAGRYGKAGDAAARYTAHARLAGAKELVERSAVSLATNALLGPTPVPEAITQCEGILASGLADRLVHGIVMCTLGPLRAMQGEFEQARTLCHGGRALLRDLGQGVDAASTAIELVMVELLAGDLATAEKELRSDCDALARMGETFFFSTMAARLARVVRDQGRDSEALQWLETAEGAAAADDVEAQALLRSTRAPILARLGQTAQALQLADEAVALARQTDAMTLQASCFAELAAVLHLAARPADARQAIAEAIALSVAKGDTVSASRWTAWAGGLG